MVIDTEVWGIFINEWYICIYCTVLDLVLIYGIFIIVNWKLQQMLHAWNCFMGDIYP
jgi:hypothetical protein